MVFKVEGVDYSKEGIEALRIEIIKYRDDAMKQWPETIPITIILTHVIAILAYIIELQEEQERLNKIEKEKSIFPLQKLVVDKDNTIKGDDLWIHKDG